MKKIFDKCTFEGCGLKHKSRGYCASHYAMFRRKMPLIPLKTRQRDKPECCIEDGCSEPVKSKGLCKAHYQRLLRHGHTRYLDRKKEPKICMIPNCGDWLYAKGLCHSHYAKNRSWKKFGIDVNDFVRMYQEQNGVCKICGKPEVNEDVRSGKIKDLSIDHCHTSLKIRGLLCHNCNTAIGLLKEDITILESAIKYLRSFQ